MNIRVESAIKLEPSEKTEIEKILSKKVSDASFEFVINEKILGGLRITMNGKRIDLSLAGRLSQVENSLK